MKKYYLQMIISRWICPSQICLICSHLSRFMNLFFWKLRLRLFDFGISQRITRDYNLRLTILRRYPIPPLRLQSQKSRYILRLKFWWQSYKISYSFKNRNTVKVGYNEFEYNKLSVITIKYFSPKSSFYYLNQPGYNKTRL